MGTGEYLHGIGSPDGGPVDGSRSVDLADYWVVTDNGAQGLTLQNVSTNGYLDGDPANEGWNVDQSTAVAFDDYWKRTYADDVTDNRALPDASQITFGAFGDYGTSGGGTPAVAALVNQLRPDILVTTGDARYGGESYAGIHSYYLDYFSHFLLAS